MSTSYGERLPDWSVPTFQPCIMEPSFHLPSKPTYSVSPVYFLAHPIGAGYSKEFHRCRVLVHHEDRGGRGTHTMRRCVGFDP